MLCSVINALCQCPDENNEKIENNENNENIEKIENIENIENIEDSRWAKSWEEGSSHEDSSSCAENCVIS